MVHNKDEEYSGTTTYKKFVIIVHVLYTHRPAKTSLRISGNLQICVKTNVDKGGSQNGRYNA